MKELMENFMLARLPFICVDENELLSNRDQREMNFPPIHTHQRLPKGNCLMMIITTVLFIVFGHRLPLDSSFMLNFGVYKEETKYCLG